MYCVVQYSGALIVVEIDPTVMTRELRCINRYQPNVAYMRHTYFVKYCNRVVRQFDNLPWRSGLVPQLVEWFGRTHQGPKADRLTLNLVYDLPQKLFLCKSSSMVFEP